MTAAAATAAATVTAGPSQCKPRGPSPSPAQRHASRPLMNIHVGIRSGKPELRQSPAAPQANKHSSHIIIHDLVNKGPVPIQTWAKLTQFYPSATEMTA